MNPVTQSLLSQLAARKPADFEEIQAFAGRWDSLEGLVIRVFKGKAAGTQDEAEHRQTRAWLQAHYPSWEPTLQPFWRQARIAGKPAEADPFAFLLAVPDASGFVKNWTAMQNLPAAREALNQFLVERISSR